MLVKGIALPTEIDSRDVSRRLDDIDGPSAAELAQVEREEPVIAAELSLLDAQLEMLDGPVTDVEVRRLNRLEGRVRAARRAQLHALADVDLVRLAAEGSGEAFGVLYHRYARHVMGYAWALVMRGYGGDNTADDIASQAWLRARRVLNRFIERDDEFRDAPENAGTRAAAFMRWMRPMTKYAALDRLCRRREVAAGDMARDADIAAEPPAETMSIEQWQQIRRDLDAAMEALSPVQRQVVQLRLEGLRPVEVEKRLGWSRSRVNMAWYNAQKTLVTHARGPKPRNRARGWDDMTPDQRKQADANRGRGQYAQQGSTKAWLVAYVTEHGGAAVLADILAAGVRAGYATPTIYQARVKAGLVSVRTGKVVRWQLPADATPTPATTTA